MRLDERLRLLRAEVAPASPKGDLAERLQRLSPAVPQTVPTRVPDERALADALGAESLAPGVLRVERRFGRDRLHGRAKPGDCLQSLPDLMDEPVGRPDGWLFLDTETSGLAGGTGTWAFLCGLLRIEDHGLVLRQYLLARLDAERAYLEAVGCELRAASLLVTYNGKSFDAPLLTTRFRLAGLVAGLESKRHLDLLAAVRRAFARVWPDCRLATAEERLLGFVRHGDLPGAEAPAAWLSWLRRGEVERLAAVIRHNCRDLLSLPALTPALVHSLRDPVAAGADVGSVAGYWLARGDESRALSILSDGRDRLDEAGLLTLARLQRRRGQWHEARGIWRSLADAGHPRATEALAKYLEHRERDYEQALAWSNRLPVGPEREHRRRRLAVKLLKRRF